MSNQKIINITDSAISQIKNLSSKKNHTYIRIGIKQGGCSGMSYFMNLIKQEEIESIDQILEYKNFTLICDPKSLLYLYGMSLDYQTALIGGGFQFFNPNAIKVCGCGKSFNV
nr:hypothetical protein [Boldiaceae sp.]